MFTQTAIKKINWKSSQSGYNPGRYFTIICKDNNEYVVDTKDNSCYLSKNITEESAITDPFVKIEKYHIKSLHNLTKDNNFSWIKIASKTETEKAKAKAEAEATLAYETKLAELAEQGFIFTRSTENKKHFSTHFLFQIEDELENIYTEEGCQHFEIPLAGAEDPTKTQILSKFNLEKKLQENTSKKSYIYIKNITVDKIYWASNQNLEKQKILNLDSQINSRAKRFAKANQAIEKFLETGEINGDSLGCDSWHDSSYKAEEQAEGLSKILKFKIVTEHGYEKNLNEFDRSYYRAKTQANIKGSNILDEQTLENVLYWQVQDDGVSNHPYSNSVRLTISEEVRLNLSNSQLGWLFSHGWIES